MGAGSSSSFNRRQPAALPEENDVQYYADTPVEKPLPNKIYNNAVKKSDSQQPQKSSQNSQNSSQSSQPSKQSQSQHRTLQKSPSMIKPHFQSQSPTPAQSQQKQPANVFKVSVQQPMEEEEPEDVKEKPEEAASQEAEEEDEYFEGDEYFVEDDGYEDQAYDPEQPFDPSLYTVPKLYEKTLLVEFEPKKFTVPDHYEIGKMLGRGAYGFVCEATNKKTGQKVAIKVIQDVFSKNKDYQKRIMRELQLLVHFRHHDNIIKLFDLIPPKDFKSFDTVMFVTELLDQDLAKMMRHTAAFEEEKTKLILYQMLRGLKYIHSAEVLHRDLKPNNILFDKDLFLKICDFGLARGFDFENDPTQSTAYVVTRPYRPPELLLYSEKAYKTIDIWSVGCMFGEIIRKQPGVPLFRGRDTLGQLGAILDCLGFPPVEEMRGCQQGLNYYKGLPKKPGFGLKKLLPEDIDPVAYDLLKRMLEINPEKRITAEEALKHPYLADYHATYVEPIAKKPFDQSLLGNDYNSNPSPSNSTSSKSSTNSNSEKDMLFGPLEIKKHMYNEIRKWNLVFNKVWTPPASIDLKAMEEQHSKMAKKSDKDDNGGKPSQITADTGKRRTIKML